MKTYLGIDHFKVVLNI